MKKKEKVKNKEFVAMEGYKGPQANELDLQKSAKGVTERGALKYAGALMFSICDGIVIYNLFEMAMTQSMILGIFLTVLMAVIMNFVPVFTAKCLHQIIYKTDRFAVYGLIISLLIFLIPYIGIMKMRFAFEDRYGVNDLTRLVNEVSSIEEEYIEDDEKVERTGRATVTFLCLEPLGTSLFSLLLAFWCDDELKRRRNKLRMRRVELQEEANDIMAKLENLNVLPGELLALDRRCYETAQKEVNTIEKQLKAATRHVLAEYLAGSSQISKLCEEAQAIKEQPDYSELDRTLSRLSYGMDIIPKVKAS